ncbi:MAG: KamA family radical SAM protein [Alphaproteobacteria bacterium]|nr:KamA family radical SAM protein [Alphaproteobacteria bacterium]
MDRDVEVAESEPPSSPGLAKDAPATAAARPASPAAGIAHPPGTAPKTPLFPASIKERERAAYFPQSARSKAFRKRFFPNATAADWNDWRWQSRNRLRTLAQLERVFALSPDEREAIKAHQGSLPVGITPYYAALMAEADPAEPLRRTHIPVMGEYLRAPGEADDPLGEDHDAAVPNLVHRYPDRVLFLATGFCSTYCRYCTRSRMVGEAGGDYHFSTREWDRQIEYIAAHPEIRDCLISGGDPLTLSTDKLENLLSRLRAIPHLEFIRLGTKVPVVLPQRITRDLMRMLRRYHPVWMSIHFTHPSELTPEVHEACTRLADAGIPLGSQTVLLKGINDSVETMKPLMHGLLKMRVKPYYLYQCDPITGSAHFRTTIDKGIEIIEGLRGHTTGYAVPTYVVDAPGGGGKIPLIPDYLLGRDGEDVLLRNFEGNVYRYTDPEGRLGRGRRVAPEMLAKAPPRADTAKG